MLVNIRVNAICNPENISKSSWFKAFFCVLKARFLFLFHQLLL
jgi:hypothetical protein